MRNQNQKTSHTDVMPALANFAQEAVFQGDIQELPSNMQEIIDRLLETEHGNELHIRLKMMRCRDLIKLFAQTLEPFTYDQLMLQTNKHCNE